MSTTQLDRMDFEIHVFEIRNSTSRKIHHPNYKLRTSLLGCSKRSCSVRESNRQSTHLPTHSPKPNPAPKDNINSKNSKNSKNLGPPAPLRRVRRMLLSASLSTTPLLLLGESQAGCSQDGPGPGRPRLFDTSRLLRTPNATASAGRTQRLRTAAR